MVQFGTGGGEAGVERYEDILIVEELASSHVRGRMVRVRVSSVIPHTNLLTPVASQAGTGGPGLSWALSCPGETSG